jgi:hypothetical protein
MKKIILSVFVFILMIGNMYARGNTDAQKLGSPTPLQQIINAMPAIPIPLIGKNMKFQFGGDKWIAKINEENFLAGDCIFEENGNGYILTLNTTNVWTGAVEEVIDLLEKAGVPLGPAAGPLRTAARLAASVAKWIPFKGSAIILEYHEGPPIDIFFVKVEKQEEGTQTEERKARDRSPNILSEWGAWDKRVYLGGGMGFGNGMFTQGLVADFPLTRFFSIEVMPSIGLLDDGSHPVIPIMGKLGWRFANIELSADIGYTPLWGLTAGGTFGLNSDSNTSFFAKYIAMPFSNSYKYSNSPLMYGFLGFKVGVGNR